MNEKTLDGEERRKERWSEWGVNDLEEEEEEGYYEVVEKWHRERKEMKGDL